MPKIVAQKEDWIKLGFALFSQDGIKGIVVEKMAKKLKCNKSSFYWHFKKKEEFIDALITYWIQTDTDMRIKEIESEKDKEKKLETFLRIIFRHDPFLEFSFFLKRYARGKVRIQAIIDDIDHRRIQYASQLLHEFGCAKKESKIRAEILYKYLGGYHEVNRYKPQPGNYLEIVKRDLSLLMDFAF